MNVLKKELIELALEYDALKFGDFVLKSGKKSPYFFNAGVFNDGKSLQKIGDIYAKYLKESNIEYDVLFGPAYKGITLASITAVSLYSLGVNKPVCFNRKEAKDHGEKGQLIGKQLQGKVMLIDDVITRGTAYKEAKNIIESHGAKVAGIMIMLDRCEPFQGKSIVEEIEQENIPVISIINVFDIIDYLKNNNNPNAEIILKHVSK